MSKILYIKNFSKRHSANNDENNLYFNKQSRNSRKSNKELTDLLHNSHVKLFYNFRLIFMKKLTQITVVPALIKINLFLK